MADEPKFFGMIVHVVPVGTVVDCHGPHGSARRVTKRRGVLGVGECWMTAEMWAEAAKAYDRNSDRGVASGRL